MKITMNDALMLQEGINKISNKLLNINTAYKLMKIQKSLVVELEFYQKEYKRIIDEFSEKGKDGAPVLTEDGQGYKILPGKEQQCNTNLMNLLKLEVTIPDITFDIKEFSDLDMSLNDFYPFMVVISDGE
jgi:hypothetical protein